jgi:general secretion pathway protein B
MSYILDALKKSDQERQQGASPNLHSTHGPIIGRRRNSSAIFKQHQKSYLVLGGVVFFCIALGIFFFQQHLFFSETASTRTPDAAPLSATPQTPTTVPPAQVANQDAEKNDTPSPPVSVREKGEVEPSMTKDESTSGPSTGIPPESVQSSVPPLPLLEELPQNVQAGIPPLKFAGHTYAAKPSQRIIIINGKILREGDVIAPRLFLKEITWEGVAIESNNIRFRVKTN